MQTIYEELPQEHINKAVANFTKHLTANVVGHFEHLSISKSASYLSTIKPAPFRAANRLPGKTTLVTLRNGGLPRLKQYFFHF